MGWSVDLAALTGGSRTPEHVLAGSPAALAFLRPLVARA